jgi:L-ascorbate metabolism protein UlaG (beta-lactamase superfamily)
LLNQNDIHLTKKCTAHESTLHGARAFVLDNGIFRISVLPEYGGRICSLYYRQLGREILATDFLHHPPPARGFNVRGGWCAAFPSLLADGELLTNNEWEAEITLNTPEAVTVKMTCAITSISHSLGGMVRHIPATITVNRIVSLVAGGEEITVEDIITNSGAWPMPVTWAAAISLRASDGDKLIIPSQLLTLMNGDGPTTGEINFTDIKTTPYQSMAVGLRDGWTAFRPADMPVDIKIEFPVDLLPNMVVMAHRDKVGSDNYLRVQPLATKGPLAEDGQGNALVLPPNISIRLPIKLTIGNAVVNTGRFGTEALKIATIINDTKVPSGRAGIWRVGGQAVVIKTHKYLIFVMPEFNEDTMLTPEDLTQVDLILVGDDINGAQLAKIAHRTSARIIGSASVRQTLLSSGIAGDRSVALSPGARFDLPGLGIVATPAYQDETGEKLGFLIQSDYLALYHTGNAEFIGEFSAICESFHPQCVLIPLDGRMTHAETLQAVKLLQPRMTVPLGTLNSEMDFSQKGEAQIPPIATTLSIIGNGFIFDGYRAKEITNILEDDDGTGTGSLF